MAQITSTFIKLIDEWYYDNIRTVECSKYVIEIFDEWVKEQTIVKDRKTVERTYISKPTYKFLFNNKEVILSFPNIPIKDTEDFDTSFIDIKLTIGNKIKKLVHQKDFKVIKRIGFNSIVINDYINDDPINNVSFIVFYNGLEVYNSLDMLNRNYLMFNEKGKEIFNNTDYDGMINIISKEKLSYDNVCVFNYKNYYLNYFKVESSKVYKIANERIYFSKMIEESIEGKKVKNVKAFINEQEIAVYNEVYYYTFEAVDKKEDLYLRVNNREYQLKDFLTDDTMFDGSYRYTVDISKLNLNSGIYTLILSADSKRTLKTNKFIIDKDFLITLESKDQELVYDIKIDSFFNLDIKEELDFDFSKNATFNAFFRLGVDNVNYKCYLGIPRYKYKKDDQWDLVKDFELISDKLYLTKDILRFEVLVGELNRFSLDIECESDDYYVYDLNRLKTLSNSYDIINTELIIDQNNLKHNVFYLKETIIGRPQIIFKNGKTKLAFNIKCLKNNDLLLEMRDKEDNVIEYPFIGKEIILGNYNLYERYEIIVRYKNNSFFGIIKDNLYEGKLIIGDTERLSGKTFKISKLGYWLGNDEADMEIRPTGIKFLHKLDMSQFNSFGSNFNYENNTIYECQLYKLSYTGSIYPFRSDYTLYAEIDSPRESTYMTLYLETNYAEGITFDQGRKFIDEKENPKNDAINYLIVDTSEGEIK